VSLGKLRQKRDRSGLKIRDLRRPTESGSPPALRTFLAIADLWGLMEEHRLLVLGYPSRSTYHNWCKQAREHGAFTLNVDVLARISALLGIHQALGILFPTERLGAEWLRTAHNAVFFGGRPPLDLVSSGSQDGLLSVRHFLDGARGGHYMRPNAIDEASTPIQRHGNRLPVTDTFAPAPRPTYRLIPTQFPLIGLFDTVATTADLSAVMELVGWTNDRVVAERIGRLPQSEWVHGVPNASGPSLTLGTRP
jgi:hypothetical protein